MAVTTSLWQPRRLVRVVVATTSLGGSPEAGQLVTGRQAGQACPEKALHRGPAGPDHHQPGHLVQITASQGVWGADRL